MTTAILFKTCLGFNDSRTFGTLKANPETGATELSDCLNLTITPDGCLEKIPAFVIAHSHTDTITNISARNRFIFQDTINTMEWDGINVAAIGTVLTGPVVHTPIDVRVSSSSKVYKSTVSGHALIDATLGDTSNIPPTSTPFYAQPAFKQSFEYRGFLYAVNISDSRFLQHSEYTQYDVWAIGDRFIGLERPILQTGAINGTQGSPGCIVATHANGITVFIGSNKSDFTKKFYPCEVANNTLYSGFISKVLGFGHVFICADGVYMVGSDGTITNLTVNQTNYIDALNSTYTCSTIQNGKYFAFGNAVCLEYDFTTKAPLKRSSFGVSAATAWDNTTYYSIGNNIVKSTGSIDASSQYSCSLTLPYSDFGAQGRKTIEALYFTGTIDGDVVITATDQSGESWTLELSFELIAVSNYRIKTPQRFLGNHISLHIECTSGTFRLEELRAAFTPSNRSR